MLGYLADQIGRRKLVIGFLVSLTLVQLLTALSPNYVLFTLGRFLVGFFVAGGVTLYILACEIIGAPQRSLLAVTTAISFGLAYGCLAFAALVIPYWRGLTLLSAVITLTTALFSK